MDSVTLAPSISRNHGPCVCEFSSVVGTLSLTPQQWVMALGYPHCCRGGGGEGTAVVPLEELPADLSAADVLPVICGACDLMLVCIRLLCWLPKGGLELCGCCGICVLLVGLIRTHQVAPSSSNSSTCCCVLLAAPAFPAAGVVTAGFW